jgi:hypothetical protein
MGRYFSKVMPKAIFPGSPNARIASNEARLVIAPRGQNPKGRAVGFGRRQGGRRLLMGEVDYQAAVPQPEIDLIPVKDYDAGARFLREEFVTMEQLDQDPNQGVNFGEIPEKLLSIAPFAIGAVILYALVKGVRTS